jgi:hypothetical protein
MINLLNVFKENISRVIKYVNEFNYFGCSVVTRDLTATFLYCGSRKGVFISEFLEWLFKNMDEELHDKRTSEKIQEKLVNFLKEIKDIDIFDEKQDIRLINKMIEIRYEVTFVQREAWETRRKLKGLSKLIE